MSDEPAPLVWTERPVERSPHTALDLTSTRSLDDELAGLGDYTAYCKEYRLGVGKDYADLRALGCVRRAGVDREGNPLYLIVPGNLLADSDLARVRRYAFQLLAEHAHADRPFSLVYVQNNVESDAAQPSIWFVVSTYRMLPVPLKRNLRMIGIVHPTDFVRTAMLLLAPFLADSFWDKLYLIERLEFLDQVIGGAPERLEALELPQAYFDWDAELDSRAAEDAEALRTGSLFHGGLGMGGVMGGAAFSGGVPPR